MREHRRTIDRGDEHGGPALPYRERNRSSNQPEADYGESIKWRFV
jgi:hypothetical protein